ncbi:uncharacterized protein EKO05_0003544 [Ascochyta rabiei]|uniref:uncharacterized protein n=1 Tax=Didymella rabiei TaxID=5454 RepID=UPI002203481F|nr:uncharacterized protein EKO05_0003544 [Ascochyta rabiei]UPX13015.1 hypothetical protein EKO05_0003544 [Ascochyta rabiei]
MGGRARHGTRCCAMGKRETSFLIERSLHARSKGGLLSSGPRSRTFRQSRGGYPGQGCYSIVIPIYQHICDSAEWGSAPAMGIGLHS